MNSNNGILLIVKYAKNIINITPVEENVSLVKIIQENGAKGEPTAAPST